MAWAARILAQFPEGIVVQFVIGKLADTAFPGDPDAIVFLANDDDVLYVLPSRWSNLPPARRSCWPTIIRRAEHRIPLQYNL